MKKLDLKYFPYPTIRPAQLEILEKMKNNWDKYKYFVIEAPPGIGKSAIAKTICSSVNTAFLITATKQLQDQYMRDFPNSGVVSIKGRANYKCVYGDKLNCEMGPCMVNKDLLKECKLNHCCPYYSKREEALASNTVLTSYQYFLRAMDCAGFWKPRDVLILDECHLLEQQVTQWASTFLSPIELHTKYNIFEGVDPQIFMVYSVAPETSGYKANEKWLHVIWKLIMEKRKELYKEIAAAINANGKPMPDDPNWLSEEDLEELASTHKEYYELDKYYRRLEIFFELSNEEKANWIIEPQDNGIMMQPVNIDNLFKYYMNEWGKEKVIFMSATILDTAGFCNELKLPKDKTAIIKMDPIFEPEKSPIVYYPTGNMSYQYLDSTMPKILENVKEILAMYPNEKGIIHTGNYKIAKAICEGIDNPRLIMKDEDGNNEKLLKKHSKSAEATVLVSPSLTTGADLKDNLSRFQVFVKMPFSSLADKRVQKKIEYNDNWYVSEMFRTLVQACGRSTRSENDWSVTYILDTSFYYWIAKYRKWFSKQFHKRIIWKKEEFNLDKFIKQNKK